MVSDSTEDFCCPSDYDRIGCLTCALSKFAPHNESERDLLIDTSDGCTLCDTANNFHPNLYTKQDGTIGRGCQFALPTGAAQEDDQCDFGSVIVTNSNDRPTCTDCSSVIDGCLFCSSTRTCL
jgi:hypothetical protein